MSPEDLAAKLEALHDLIDFGDAKFDYDLYPEARDTYFKAEEKLEEIRSALHLANNKQLKELDLTMRDRREAMAEVGHPMGRGIRPSVHWGTVDTLNGDTMEYGRVSARASGKLATIYELLDDGDVNYDMENFESARAQYQSARKSFCELRADLAESADPEDYNHLTTLDGAFDDRSRAMAEVGYTLPDEESASASSPIRNDAQEVFHFSRKSSSRVSSVGSRRMAGSRARGSHASKVTSSTVTSGTGAYGTQRNSAHTHDSSGSGGQTNSDAHMRSSSSSHVPVQRNSKTSFPTLRDSGSSVAKDGQTDRPTVRTSSHEPAMAFSTSELSILVPNSDTLSQASSHTKRSPRFSFSSHEPNLPKDTSAYSPDSRTQEREWQQKWSALRPSCGTAHHDATASHADAQEQGSVDSPYVSLSSPAEPITLSTPDVFSLGEYMPQPQENENYSRSYAARSQAVSMFNGDSHEVPERHRTLLLQYKEHEAEAGPLAAAFPYRGFDQLGRETGLLLPSDTPDVTPSYSTAWEDMPPITSSVVMPPEKRDTALTLALQSIETWESRPSEFLRSSDTLETLPSTCLRNSDRGKSRTSAVSKDVFFPPAQLRNRAAQISKKPDDTRFLAWVTGATLPPQEGFIEVPREPDGESESSQGGAQTGPQGAGDWGNGQISRSYGESRGAGEEWNNRMNGTDGMSERNPVKEGVDGQAGGQRKDFDIPVRGARDTDDSGREVLHRTGNLHNEGHRGHVSGEGRPSVRESVHWGNTQVLNYKKRGSRETDESHPIGTPYDAGNTHDGSYNGRPAGEGRPSVRESVHWGNTQVLNYQKRGSRETDESHPIGAPHDAGNTHDSSYSGRPAGEGRPSVRESVHWGNTQVRNYNKRGSRETDETDTRVLQETGNISYTRHPEPVAEGRGFQDAHQGAKMDRTPPRAIPRDTLQWGDSRARELKNTTRRGSRETDDSHSTWVINKARGSYYAGDMRQQELPVQRRQMEPSGQVASREQRVPREQTPPSSQSHPQQQGIRMQPGAPRTRSPQGQYAPENRLESRQYVPRDRSPSGQHASRTRSPSGQYAPKNRSPSAPQNRSPSGPPPPQNQSLPGQYVPRDRSQFGRHAPHAQSPPRGYEPRIQSPPRQYTPSEQHHQQHYATRNQSPRERYALRNPSQPEQHVLRNQSQPERYIPRNQSPPAQYMQRKQSSREHYMPRKQSPREQYNVLPCKQSPREQFAPHTQSTPRSNAPQPQSPQDQFKQSTYVLHSERTPLATLSQQTVTSQPMVSKSSPRLQSSNFAPNPRQVSTTYTQYTEPQRETETLADRSPAQHAAPSSESEEVLARPESLATPENEKQEQARSESNSTPRVCDSWVRDTHTLRDSQETARGESLVHDPKRVRVQDRDSRETEQHGVSVVNPKRVPTTRYSAQMLLKRDTRGLADGRHRTQGGRVRPRQKNDSYISGDSRRNTIAQETSDVRLPRPPRSVPAEEPAREVDWSAGLQGLVGKELALLRNLSNTDVSWEDVFGYEDVKQRLRDHFVHRKPLHPLSKRSKGVLLFGPPGCGKTLLAQALATEIGPAFFALSVSKFKTVTEATDILSTLFSLARKITPSVIFLDDISEIFDSHTGWSKADAVAIRDVFHAGMESVSREDVLILACTSAPFHLVSSFYRLMPCKMHVPLPDQHTRQSILKMYCRKWADVDSKTLDVGARLTGQYSAQDLIALSMRAISLAEAEDPRRPCYLEPQHFSDAMTDCPATMSKEEIERYRDWAKDCATI